MTLFFVLLLLPLNKQKLNYEKKNEFEVQFWI